MTTYAPSLPAQSQVLPTDFASNWMAHLLSNRVAYHVVFWAFVFSFNAAYIAFIGEDRDVSLYNLGFRIPFILACCYLNMYYLMPRFYYPGKLLGYGVLVLASIFLLNAINLYFLELFVDTPICPTTYEADATFNGSNYVYKGFYLFTLVGLTSGIKLSKNQLAERQKAEAIEKEKLQTELSLLKSQINPHFFFNTLNNLYALTMKKSDQAPEVVLKLSDLMSYSLYESEGVTVSLEKEIAHIRNYIELETVRLSKKMDVVFEVRGAVGKQVVPPLLFLPVIENCFKHASNKVHGGEINICLEVAENTITLTTRNPYQPMAALNRKSGGLGLKNVQRRLQLLFGSRYRFEKQLSNELYACTLQIPIT